LIDFCGMGDLGVVCDWIAKGNPINPPWEKKHASGSPLQISIERRFLTHTEKLLDAGTSPMANGNALRHAMDQAIPKVKSDA
jgi:hypothetical protein